MNASHNLKVTENDHGKNSSPNPNPPKQKAQKEVTEPGDAQKASLVQRPKAPVLAGQGGWVTCSQPLWFQ